MARGAGRRMSALNDIRIIELGSFIAGPFACQTLADLGAQVIKVEPPGGDPIRQWGRKTPEGESLWWPVIGRNKRSVCIDLKRPQGLELLRGLIAQADVLCENFRPGVLERMGLAPETLWQCQPGLIVTRVSGYGQDGPYRERAGFASVAESIGGMRYLNGFPDRPPPRSGLSIGDSIAGLFAALGTLSALHERERTGRGQVVDVGLTDAILGVMESVISEYSGIGHIRERTGATLPGLAPSNLYPTRDGGWIVIGANADKPFRRLCQAMGRPELAQDPRYAGHTARGEHQAELDELVRAWTLTRDQAELDTLLAEHGVPAGPLNNAAGVLADPHLRARGAVTEVETDIGRLWMQNVVPRLTRTPGTVRWAGARLGAHTREVLEELLTLDAKQIQSLHDQGVVKWP